MFEYAAIAFSVTISKIGGLAGELCYANNPIYSFIAASAEPATK